MLVPVGGLLLVAGAGPARLVELAEAADRGSSPVPYTPRMCNDSGFVAMAGSYPRRFGKYVLLKPMARGGMGEIYLASTGEPASKSAASSRRSSPSAVTAPRRKRFLDEAKVVLRLSHANLVPTFDAGEIDGEFFIAMDLVEGKDLREIWNRCVRTRTRIPLDVALHVGREVARALCLRPQLRRSRTSSIATSRLPTSFSATSAR